MLSVKKILFLLFAISIASCAITSKSNSKKSIQEILTGLAAIEGKFVWRTDLKRYVYSDKVKIENLLSSRNKMLVIQTLTGCLDNALLSKSFLNESNVVLGVICYEALSQTIYHEPILPNGDIAEKWDGYILPNASLNELKAAKRAWSKVIDEKKYSFL